MDQAEALEHVTPFLFVGNNRYQTAGLKIGTRSRLDSGQLWGARRRALIAKISFVRSEDASRA
jgi:hypothetical protein